MATPNYGYEKRQKELAKKRKKEDKLKAKSERRPDTPGGDEAPGETSTGVDQTAQPDLAGTPTQP